MNIQGIDKAIGLEIVNYDEELFEEILQIYYEDGIEMLNTLKKNLQHTDLKLFITHIHAMKSASYGIGATEMSERFKEIEFAGKDEDLTLIEQLLPSCLLMFEKLLNDLKVYFDSGADDRVLDDEIINKMIKALEQMETDMFDNLFKKVYEETYTQDIIKKLNGIRNAYEEFDYDLVITLLKQLQ